MEKDSDYVAVTVAGPESRFKCPRITGSSCTCTAYCGEYFGVLSIAATSAHVGAPTETPTDPSLKAAEPVDMILHCPTCGLQHVDAPEEAADRDDPDYHCPPRWTNPPHRSHLCHGCGHIWRPADVPTNGVATIKTKGKNDRPAGPMDVNSKAEPVAYAAKDYRTGKFGYIWHEKEDVQGWINLQHQMQDSITWLGPIALDAHTAKTTVPEGLIDRVNAALQRIEENRAPRRIPADPTDVDLVLSEVLMLLKGKYERPFWVAD